MAQDGDKPQKDETQDTKPETDSKADATKAASTTPADAGPANGTSEGAAPAPTDSGTQPAKPATGPASAPTAESTGESAAEQVIARFGGLRPTATKLGVAVSTVQGWKARGHVPETRHEELRNAAAAHDIDISDIDLTAHDTASGDKPAQPKDAVATTAINPWAIPADGGKQAEPGSTPASPMAGGRSTAVSSAADKTADQEAAPDRQDDERGFRDRERENEQEDLELHDRHAAAPAAARGGGGVVLGFLLAILLFVGGAAGAVFTRTYWEPFLPTAPADGLQTDLDALSDRVADLENAPPSADPARLDALSQQFDDLTQEVARQPGNASGDGADAEALADLDRRIAELAAQVQETAAAAGPDDGPPAAPGVDPAVVSGLEDRVAALQSTIGDLRTAVAENSSATATAAAAAAQAATADADALSDLQSRLGDLQGQLQQVQEQAQQALSASAGDSGLALALGQLRDALRFSASFEVELAAVERLIPAGDPLLELLAPLAAHAVTGVPTRDELALRFEPMAQAAVAASYDDSWSGRLMSRVSQAVSVRPVGEVEGDSPRARIARADARLANADLSGAVEALSGIEGAPAAVAEPWLTDANARLAGERALGELTRRTLARLTPTASAANE